ncbi:MAG: hypothetical protein SFY68_01990 [Candidatus Sumerlaeia bacterium]|nr:hypothetical protein [Candidatus Sumerlaeia bacterium]
MIELKEAANGLRIIVMGILVLKAAGAFLPSIGPWIDSNPHVSVFGIAKAGHVLLVGKSSNVDEVKAASEVCFFGFLIQSFPIETSSIPLWNRVP